MARNKQGMSRRRLFSPEVGEIFIFKQQSEGAHNRNRVSKGREIEHDTEETGKGQTKRDPLGYSTNMYSNCYGMSVQRFKKFYFPL